MCEFDKPDKTFVSDLYLIYYPSLYTTKSARIWSITAHNVIYKYVNIILYNNLNYNLTIDDILVSLYFLVMVEALGLVAYVVVEEDGDYKRLQI